MFERVCGNVAVRCVESCSLEFCSYCFKYLNEHCLQSAKFFVWCYMKSARNTIQHEREQWMLGVGQFWWTPTYPSSVPSTIILLPFSFDGRLNYSNFKFEITYKSDSHVKFTPLLCCQLSLIIKNEHQTWILAIQHASNTPIPKKTAWWLSLDWSHLRISSVDSNVKTIFHNTVPQESNAF